MAKSTIFLHSFWRRSQIMHRKKFCDDGDSFDHGHHCSKIYFKIGARPINRVRSLYYFTAQARCVDNTLWKKLEKLKNFGLVTKPDAGIIALLIPEGRNIRSANYHFHNAGIFINAIEYPAVPLDEQRFRISFMSDHTREDIDRLAEEVEYVWSQWFHVKDKQCCYKYSYWWSLEVSSWLYSRRSGISNSCKF